MTVLTNSARLCSGAQGRVRRLLDALARPLFFWPEPDGQRRLAKSRIVDFPTSTPSARRSARFISTLPPNPPIRPDAAITR
jgi:hypothetical protein